MLNLFKRTSDPRPVITVRLNARLQPLHRDEHFEAPLDAWLRENGLGEVSGGGTAFTPEAGVLSCDLELRLVSLDRETLDQVSGRLKALGAPAGSALIVEATGEAFPLGDGGGLALHLNGTDLPDETYASCDPDELIAMLNAALAGRGKVMSHHDGATETSLYLYGGDNDAMRAAIAPVLASYPLCERARLERLA
jgi:hypothetical protein